MISFSYKVAYFNLFFFHSALKKGPPTLEKQRSVKWLVNVHVARLVLPTIGHWRGFLLDKYREQKVPKSSESQKVFQPLTEQTKGNQIGPLGSPNRILWRTPASLSTQVMYKQSWINSKTRPLLLFFQFFKMFSLSLFGVFLTWWLAIFTMVGSSLLSKEIFFAFDCNDKLSSCGTSQIPKMKTGTNIPN